MLADAILVPLADITILMMRKLKNVLLTNIPPCRKNGSNNANDNILIRQ